MVTAGKENELRNRILDLVGEYARAEFETSEPFVPGKSRVRVSGKTIGAEEIQSAVDACMDGWFTTGRFSDQFEKNFAKYMEQRHCILTNSGSSANLLALSALTSPLLGKKKLVPGDEVITVAAGFPTTVNPIIQNGLVPVFVDVNLSDYGIDTNQLRNAWSPKVKAVVLAHTLGNPFDIKNVVEFAREHDLFLIEDCCDAVGARYQGRMVGTFGDLATVSFYPAHHITMGEGGAVLTGDPKLKKIVESFRDWGRDCWCAPGNDNTCGKRFEWQLGNLPEGYDHKYIYSHVGYNLKLTDMQAAIGCAQLPKLPEFVRKRAENFSYLYSKLEHLSDCLALPQQGEQAEPSWFGFPIRVRPESPVGRDDLTRSLNESQVDTRLIFGGNLVKQPAYRETNYRMFGELENSDTVMNDAFWVGIYPGITREMMDHIADVLDRELAGAAAKPDKAALS